jgi:hypothetical protein
MPSEQRCPKYPSMLKAFCSHCHGLKFGTREIRESFYEGYPVVEVLKDGGPVHGYDSNFRFGVRKAQMIVSCLEVLRDFWHACDETKLRFEPRLIQDLKYGLRVQTSIEMHPEFELSNGETVSRPWLRLQALSPDKEHLGLGAMKCRALCSVAPELVSWLQRHRANR